MMEAIKRHFFHIGMLVLISSQPSSPPERDRGSPGVEYRCHPSYKHRFALYWIAWSAKIRARESNAFPRMTVSQATATSGSLIERRELRSHIAMVCPRSERGSFQILTLGRPLQHYDSLGARLSRRGFQNLIRSKGHQFLVEIHCQCCFFRRTHTIV
jgi:hypothetical protein